MGLKHLLNYLNPFTRKRKHRRTKHKKSRRRQTKRSMRGG